MKTNYKIMSCLIFSIITISILFISSKFSSNEKNGFQRLFAIYSPKIINTLDIKFNSYYIIGLSETRFFLGNSTAPLHYISISYDLKDSLHRVFDIDQKNQKIDWKSVNIRLDSPNVFFTEYRSPAFIVKPISSSNLHSWKLENLRYDLVHAISPRSMIVRSYEPKTGSAFLQKISLNPKIHKEGIYKLEKQNNNFASDGFFSYDEDSHKVFYTFYYRNQFICLDTNMNLLYRGKTIDTNSIAKIKVAEIKSSHNIEKIFSSPPRFVNKRATIHNKLFYINSAMASDNEYPNEFGSYSVIDVYQTSNGKYHHSFKLPNQFGSKLIDFKVYKNLIIAIYDHHIVTYRL